MPKGCCQCNRTKLFEKLFYRSGEKFEQQISWPPLQSLWHAERGAESAQADSLADLTVVW